MISEEVFTNEDLNGDNGINEHDKGLYGIQQEGEKLYLCTLTEDKNSQKLTKREQKNDQTKD